MCTHRPHYSAPSSSQSAEDTAAEKAKEQAEIAAQNTLNASAQGNAQDTSTKDSAVMMNQQRVRRRLGADSTFTGAAEGYPGLGVGVKTGLGM